MKSIYILLLAFLGIILFSCKADPKNSSNKDHIFSNYYVRYLEQEQELKAEATFRQGDSMQTAKDKLFKNVFFKGNEMKVQKVEDRPERYVLKQKNATAPDTLIFSFINDNGIREFQELSMSPTKNLGIIGTVSKSNGITVSWEGKALSPQESVVALFTNKANKTTSTVIKGPSNESKITIPPSKLNSIDLGDNSFYLVRKKRTKVDEELRHKFAQIEFYSKSINIDVKE